MDADCIDGNYLRAYSRFFAKFVSNVNPDDQLPVNVGAYDVTEGELVGEIISMTLHHLDQTYCPLSLQAHIVHLVIQEVKSLCKKQPEECGWRHQEKTYAPLKLMHTITRKVNEICFRYLDNSRLALLPPPPATPLPLVTASAVKNKRRKMEDRHVVLHDLHTIFSIQYDSIASYYAVFDGHGGQDAAVYCATHLHQYLAESIHYPTDPERALRDAFVTTDAHFIENSQTQNLRGGTTAVCALILGQKLYIAWVGDSMAMLVKRGSFEQLVNPHRPDREDEMQRVSEMGGVVMENYGVWRVNGNLSISRAIGDIRYKPFVTSDPDIRSIWLDGTEDFLILACDGFWDFVNNEIAATIVYDQIRQSPNDLSRVHKSLIYWAKLLGSLDNITVIVVFLTPPSEIAARPPDAQQPHLPYPATDGMNNMDPNHPYLSMSNDEYDVNATYAKQQQQQQHQESDPEDGRRANGEAGQPASNSDDEDADRRRIILCDLGNNATYGKRENGGQHVYDYEDFGPETDVDAVDEADDDDDNDDADRHRIILCDLGNNATDGKRETDVDAVHKAYDHDDDLDPHRIILRDLGSKATDGKRETDVDAVHEAYDDEDDNDDADPRRIILCDLGNKGTDGKRETDVDAVHEAYHDEDDDDDADSRRIILGDLDGKATNGERDAMATIHAPPAELEMISRDVFTGEKPRADDVENERRSPSRDGQLDEDETSAEPRDTKSHQNALISDADNVADSEDSEDEWNYYRIDPNKEKNSRSTGDDEKHENESRSPDPQEESNAVENQPSEVELHAETGIDSPVADVVRHYEAEEEVVRHCEAEEDVARHGEGEKDVVVGHYETEEVNALEEESQRSEKDHHLLEEESHQSEEDLQPSAEESHQSEKDHLSDEETLPVEEDAHESHQEYDTEIHPAEGEEVQESFDPYEKEVHSIEENVPREEVDLLQEEVHRAEPEETEHHFEEADSHVEEESQLEEASQPLEETLVQSLEEEIHPSEPEICQTEGEVQSPEIEAEEAESRSVDVEVEEKRESEDKENIPPKLIDTDISAEEESEGTEEATFVEEKPQEKEPHTNMDFPLNPDAAEFVPVSPPSIGTRMNLVSDFPISGSPLKQVSPMDDIAVPSQREFEAEVCQRPREIEEDNCSNGDHSQADTVDFSVDRQRAIFATSGLDVSEISSTKAEFGDESATSFLTATDFHRTGVSALDGSFTDSDKENYDISKDPMAMSFTPGDFQAAFEKQEVDLNAVHDLSVGDPNEQNGAYDEDAVIDDTQSSKLNFEEQDFTSDKIDEQIEGGADSTFVTHSSAAVEEKDDELDRQFSPVDDLTKQDIEFDVHKDSGFGFGRNSSPFEPIAEKMDTSSALLDPQEEACVMEKTTPSTVSPVPDKTEFHFDYSETELVAPMENVHISSSTQDVVSTMHADAAEFKPGQRAFDPFPVEEKASVTNHVEELNQEPAHSETQNILDFGNEQISSPQPEVELNLVAESVIEEQPKENLLEFGQESEFSPKDEELISTQDDGKDICVQEEAQDDLICPLKSEIEPVEKEITHNVEDDFAKTETICNVEEVKEEESRIEDSFTLSDSMKENITVEAEKPSAPVEESHVEIHEESITKEELEEPEVKKDVPAELETSQEEKIVEESVKEHEIVTSSEPMLEPEVAAVPEPVAIPEVMAVPEPVTIPEPVSVSEPTVEPEPAAISESEPAALQEKHDEESEKPVVESQEEKADSKVAAVAAAAATAVAATTVAAAAVAKTKAKPATKSSKPATTTKTAAPKSTPTSPSKTVSSSTKTSSATAPKKTTTSTAARPKQLDSSTKSTVSSTVSKTALSKTMTTTKTSTSTRPTTRASLGAAPAKPKPAPAAAAKAAEKKPTTNGEVKPKTTTTGAKAPTSKPPPPASTTGQTAKTTTLVKSTATARTTSSTATSAKPRATSAVTTSKPTSKPASTTTNTTGTMSTARPKTAPTTVTSSSTAKSRLSTAPKSPMIDKQIKESANKQISLARTTNAAKTGSRTATSGPAATTVKRATATAKTTTANLTSPTKKTTSSTTKAKTVSKSTTKTVVKSKVVQNGISEKTEESIITNSGKIYEDIPKKDLSPVVAPTDNQLIVSAD